MGIAFALDVKNESVKSLGSYQRGSLTFLFMIDAKVVDYNYQKERLVSNHVLPLRNGYGRKVRNQKRTRRESYGEMLQLSYDGSNENKENSRRIEN